MTYYPNGHHTAQLSRNMFDLERSDLGSCKKVEKLLNGMEVDRDYKNLLELLTDTNDEETNIIEDKDHGDNETEYDDASDNDKDPQYSLFLKELTENGKSYKLKISRSDETPCFLKYEELDEYEPPTDTNINFGYNGDSIDSENTIPMQIDQRVKNSLLFENRKSLTWKEDSRKKKINVHNSITEPHINGYQVLLDGCVPSQHGVFNYEGKLVKYEEICTSSDSEILMWENDKQASPAEKDSHLKEKLLHILKKPYDQQEYEELLEYAEKENPICRLLPLRHSNQSFALNGVTKSVLDYVPAIGRKLAAAQNDRPKALNLLRMLRFWLEYLPNEDSFKPWADEDCLRARPSSRTGYLKFG